MGTSYRNPLGRATMGRRRLLKGAVLGSASLTALLAACKGAGQSGSTGKGASAGPGNAGGQPRRGGTLIHAGGAGVGSYDLAGLSLDPHVGSILLGRGLRLLYQGLLAYNLRTYDVVPELAQKWEQPSQTEYLFHLQPGVKWHNKPPVSGRPLTANDVVTSLNRVRTNDPQFINRAAFANFDKIEAVDPSTVHVTAKSPMVSALPYLADDNATVLAPEVLQKYQKLITPDAVIGTGAFMLKSLEENSAGEYVRNPDYWKPGLPYLDGLRTQHFSDVQSAYAAFLANRIDVLYLPGTATKEYIAKRGKGYQPDWLADDSIFYMMPNTRTKPMNDPRVPRALRLLIDHEEFRTTWAEPLFGRGTYGSVFPTAMLDQWDLSPEEYSRLLEWKQPKDDAVKEALSLLSAAGYTKDSPLSFPIDGQTGYFMSPANELIQAQWSRLGQGVVKPAIQQHEPALISKIEASQTFTVVVTGIAPAFPDPDAWLTGVYRTGGALNVTGLSDPALDAMIDKQRTIFDHQQRQAAVRDIVRYMVDRAPSTIMSNRYYLNGVKPTIQNYAPEFYMNGRQYESVWFSA